MEMFVFCLFVNFLFVRLFVCKFFLFVCLSVCLLLFFKFAGHNCSSCVHPRDFPFQEVFFLVYLANGLQYECEIVCVLS